MTDQWCVIRQDTHGNRYLFAPKPGEAALSKEDAERIAQKFNDKGHHQGYWASPYPPNIPDIAL
ncbi:MAG: hypothetical protein LRY76_06655 [Alphaproteobacteria bacterium]|nr:hypothetical protein [Alphaproteobacteria bacterium]MCD8571186.1 hypothetical protein [Alphaproteobacteria bacterium]